MQLVDATAANVTRYAEDFAALIHATGSAQEAQTRAKRPEDPDIQPEPDTEVQDERLRANVEMLVVEDGVSGVSTPTTPALAAANIRLYSSYRHINSQRATPWT